MAQLYEANQKTSDKLKMWRRDIRESNTKGENRKVERRHKQ